MEERAGQCNQQGLHGFLDVLKHFCENLGTETKGDMLILDIHFKCKTIVTSSASVVAQS
jgi:hypothetical protein